MLSLGRVKESAKEEKLKSRSCCYSPTLTVCTDLSVHVQKGWERVSRGCNTSKYKVMPTGLHTSSSFIVKPHHRHDLASVSDTHSSMALFHMMTYPDKMKDSMLTMCVFPRSVPTYSHLLWKGRWQKVILQREGGKQAERPNNTLCVSGSNT